MCNCKVIGIKSVSSRGIRVAAVPCGVCPTCRKREQLEWSFRLKTELLSLPKDEWYCVFFTMTYNDYNLPHFPRSLLNDDGLEKYKESDLPMCFSKKDVREFQTNLRYWLERECGAKNEKRYKWMTCAEYGEHTKRCHYHTLLCVPSFVDKTALFEKVKELWTPNGFIFPRNINGGLDHYGYNHKPFVVDNIYKAAAYVSKYISKDIAFEESIDRTLFKKQLIIHKGTKYEHKIRLSDYTCFHLQSRSIGASFCENLTSEQKKEYLEKGFFFNGDEFCHHMPKYFREKFLFENYYLKVGEKRLVRKYPTEFFRQNYKDLFDSRVVRMREKLVDFQLNYRPLIQNFLSESECSAFADLEKRINTLSEFEIAEKIVAYAGVNPQYVSRFYSPAEMWFRRYLYRSYIEGGREVVFEFLEKDCQELFGEDIEFVNTREVIEDVNKYYFSMAIIRSRIDEEPDKIKLNYERDLAYVQDAFKSCEVA